jgi:hypothetical protein
VTDHTPTTEYTPSTDDVRTQYIGTTPDRARHPHEIERRGQFDRWLESVRAEERERIARNIEGHAATDYQTRRLAYENAARIARRGA